MPVTHNQDPLPRSEVIALGAQAGAAALGPFVSRYFHEGHLHRIMGQVVNTSDEQVVVHFEHSDDDGDSDAYSALDVDYNTDTESEVTVAPYGTVVFSIPGFEARTVKKWFRVRVGSRRAHGFVTLSYFGGVLLPQQQAV